MTANLVLEFDSGSYQGELNDNKLPHGLGRLTFREDDGMDRKYYEGQWNDGKISGQGKMVFASGDIYDGGLEDGIPHGHGTFTYSSGDVETAEWENGNRHGLSR